jgi:hypothetical protein
MDLTYILQQAQRAPLTHRLNAAKEALQHCLLAALAQQGLLVDVAFIGGTALRILHRLPRYSEDMDFVWVGPPPTDKQLKAWSTTLRRALSKMGLVAHLRAEGPISVAARVTKQSFAIYLSASSPAFASFARDGLQVSFEIDLHPPRFLEHEARTLVVAHSPVTIPTLMLSSLMAGKLHILLTRRDREKGRDWYDYLWYRRNAVLPHVSQLESAIAQTAEGPEALFWMSHLRVRMSEVTWENVRHDVAPFLENPDEAAQLNPTVLGQLTPYPDFRDLADALRKLGTDHPLISQEGRGAVWTDLGQAALEGDLDAILAMELVTDLTKAKG